MPLVLSLSKGGPAKYNLRLMVRQAHHERVKERL